MKPVSAQRTALLLLVVAAASLALSLVWQIPYIYTLIGFAAWVFVGHLVTADDDIPGGWSNLDGSHSFPRTALLVKALVFGSLCALALLSSSIRGFGGLS
jgi:hypothetical protein